MVNFTVVARETVAEDPKSSSAFVTVYIRDTNDNFPVFSEDQYEVGPGCGWFSCVNLFSLFLVCVCVKLFVFMCVYVYVCKCLCICLCLYVSK